MFKNVRGTLLFAVMFITSISISGIIFTKDIFEKFVPRSLVFKNSTLLFFYAATCLSFSLSFFITGIFNFKFYSIAKSKMIPFKAYYWNYAVRSIFTGIVFLMEFVSLFVAFYWLELAIRIASALFCLSLIFMLFANQHEIENLSPPEAYQKLHDEMEELKKDKEKLLKILNKQDE